MTCASCWDLWARIGYMCCLVNKANLVHNLFLVCLSISTCFGRLCAHHQEKQLCLCDAWYFCYSVWMSVWYAYQTDIHIFNPWLISNLMHKILIYLHIIHLLTLRRIMSYIYGAPILDVSRSHTTTQHSR